MADNKWSITIPDPNNPSGAVFDGYVPAYFANSYPSFGNKNQLAAMKNIDIVDPNVLTQGPVPTALTLGTQTGAVTTLIKSIARKIAGADLCFATGGNKVYTFSSTAVTNDGNYPHTIVKTPYTGVDANEVIIYKSALYYFYNHSDSQGDIGYSANPFAATPTFDDDWGSTIPSGGLPLNWGQGRSDPLLHQALVAGNGSVELLFFANGYYVGSYNGTTMNTQALFMGWNSQVASLSWNFNRLIIAVNSPHLEGTNSVQSGIYFWDTSSVSWDGTPITINGKIGALYTKNGITFVWWQEGGQANRYNVGYISGGVLKSIRKLSGTCPLYYQVSEWEGFLAWISDGLVYLFGSGEEAIIPVKLFQYTKSLRVNSGGIGSPFGTIITASSLSTTNFELCKASGYTTDSDFKTKAFRVGGAGVANFVDLIQIETEQMATGAKCDFTLYYDKGKSNVALTQIAYAASNPTFHKILSKSVKVEDFLLYGNFANGSTTNPVKIRSIFMAGHIVPEN